MSQHLHNNPPDLKKRVSMPVVAGFLFMGAVMVCLPLLQFMMENIDRDGHIVEPPAHIPAPDEMVIPPPPDPPEPDDDIKDIVEEREKPKLTPMEYIFDRPDYSDLDGVEWTIPDPTTDAIDEIVDEIDLTRAPRPIRRKAPTYPSELRQAKISGNVYVSFVVRSDGTTSNIRVLKSSHQQFAESAMRAIRKWIFHPGEKDGREVNARVRLQIPFNIN